MPAHLAKCTKARVYCRNCDISYNYRKEKHECLSFLRDQYKNLKQSKALVEQYEQGIAAQCPNGHALYPHRGKTHWQYQDGFIFCDTCKVSDLSAHRVFWRCVHQCDFDLCHNCLYKSMPLAQGSMI